MAEEKDTGKSEVKVSEDLYLKYRSSQRGTWASQVEDDRAFYFGAQWTQTNANIIEGRGQVAPITNELIPTINLVVADLTRNDPRFYAVGREKSDAKTAGAYADTLAYIWDISEGSKHNRLITTDFEVVGMGVWMAYTDPYADNGKGEIKLSNLDPQDIYIDPNSKDPNCADAANILIVKHLAKEILEVNYPDIDLTNIAYRCDTDYPSHVNATPQDQVIRADQTDEKKYRVIDRYTKIKEQRYHVYDPFSGFEKIFTENEYLEWTKELAVIVTKLGKEEYVTDTFGVNELLDVFQNYGNIYHVVINPVNGLRELASGVENGQLAEPNSTTQLTVVNKGMLIEEEKLKLAMPLVDRIKRIFSIGDKEIANYTMEIEDYPIVIVMLHHMRNPYPMSDVRLVKSLQEQLNKIDNLIITYNQNITNVKMFVPKGSGTKKELEERGNKAGAQYFEYDAETGGVPIVVQLTQMSASLYQQRANLIQQIQRIVGAYSFQDGDMGNAPRTFKGTLTIEENMQRRTSAKQRILEEGLNRLGRVVAQMIPSVYTDRKIIRITRPNHQPKDVVLNDKKYKEDGTVSEILNDMSVGKYDIKVISGSMLPLNKTQRREEKMRLYEIGMLKDPTWYIRDMDEPDVDEILEGESALNQANQMIQQLQEQLKELDGQLQSKTREVISANEKVEVEKTKTKLNQAVNKVDANVQLTQQRLNDLVKNTKAEKSEKTEV